MIKERNSSIELLRIIAMFMILMLHFISQTGMFSSYSNNTLDYGLIWFLHSLNFVAVNIYVLISGYFLIESKFSIKKVLKIWLEISFYSILIFIIMYLSGNAQLNVTNILKAIFPIIFKNYWFPTLYIALYILSPFLNIFIKSLSKDNYKKLLIICFMFFSIWPILIPSSSNLNFGGAYSICWFINLYLIAGYIRLHYNSNKYSNFKYLLIYLLMSIITFLSLIIIEVFDINYYSNDFLYTYNSFTVVIASICLFIFFKNIKFSKSLLIKPINFISSLTFGVYLIHENPNLKNFLWSRIPVFKNMNCFELYIYI